MMQKKKQQTKLKLNSKFVVKMKNNKSLDN